MPTSSSAPATTGAPATVATTATTQAPATTAAPATTGTPGGGLADGVYDGAPDTNKWGVVQVELTVAGGQMSGITILQSPDGARKSVAINADALPTLTSEAIAAQSAKVHTVSGATYTSNSFKASLQSAIDQAAGLG